SAGAPADGRPVPRVFERDELYHGPCLDAAPDLVIHFNDGYDPKGAMARTEVFGRGALTGMHTYGDSLFYVNRTGGPTDALDITALAPRISAPLGPDPPSDMDGGGRVTAGRRVAPAPPTSRVRPRRPARDCRPGRLRV